jgi:sugar-specific transcriptional regulator TrmB
MLETVLKAAGLDSKEAQTYEHIVRSGKSTAAEILKATAIKRGDLYNVLKRLEDRKLIHPLPDVKILTYAPSDPEAIERALKAEEQALVEAKDNLSSLYSLYNLGMGKPGVRFAQGIEAIKEFFNDTLNSKTDILSYADWDGWDRYLYKYAVWYAKERRERKIKERVIIPDTLAARQYMKNYNADFTDFRFVPHDKFKFSLEMNIYDNKVLYVTLREPFIAVLIEDKDIADTQRAVFEMSWAHVGESNFSR